jgi:hypothetical protein
VQYQEEFCRDLFYAANTFWERRKRAAAPTNGRTARARMHAMCADSCERQHATQPKGR